ncbi:hypothetical protein JCM19046_2649 [Bacillus sp. JCM 19046]|nr:hypothetical protein JCM19045_809 [Bacillus sp. JCM 19045]GAF18095.1 hypothetical protein JCM19046_2649 [Bacillus sp. JCM 19046]
MKKTIGLVLALIILFTGALVAFATIDFNRLGKENRYVQISEPVEVEETRLDSGEIVHRYWYELPAVDEEGGHVVVEFSATRELRKEAYLMLYVKSNDEVTSYDEVAWEEIPDEAQETLNQVP